MKRFIQQSLFAIFLVVSMAWVLFSCRDDARVIYVGNVSVITNARPLRTNFLSNRFVVVVKCSGKGWRATCASNWVELSEKQGVDGDYLYISVAENILDEKRLAVVRFYDIEDPGTLSDYVEIIQSATSHSVNALLTAELERKHRLGYGYDIFGGFVVDSSFSQKAVLDYNFMLIQEQLGTQMITEDLRHVEELEIISANTLTELSSKLTKRETKGGSFLGCGKTTTETTEIFKEKTVDQECGMIRLKQIVTSRTIDLGAVQSVLRQSNRDSLYSADFLRAIRLVKQNLANEERRKDALRNLYRNFGSHLVLSADLGGEIRVNTVAERETSIESSNSVTMISKKIFGKKTSESVSTYNTSTESDNIHYKVELTMTGGSVESQKIIKDKADENDYNHQITDDEIIQWQSSIQFLVERSEDYNASMVDCRLIPLYDIIYDPEVAEAFKQYLVSINATQKEPSDSQIPAICSLSDLHPVTPESTEEELYAKCIRVQDTLRAVISSEYIPSIRSDKPCLVAYPIVSGRPFMYAGVFVGDSEHLPGMVRWLGNNCLYEPNEVFASDTLGYTDLLDDKGQLKSLYLYWGAVQMLPNEQVNCQEKGKFSTARMNVPDSVCTLPNPKVVKVGPHYWTRFPMVLKSSRQELSQFQSHGTAYLSTGGDPDKWTTENREWTSYLPTSTQARSVMLFLNGRSELMENSYYKRIGVSYNENGSEVFEGANMLGLNWLKGYWAIDSFGTNYLCDMNSWLIPTYEGTVLCITRLSRSGNAMTMDYGDYIQSVGFYDNQFEKFIPFYFCTDEVY